MRLASLLGLIGVVGAAQPTPELDAYITRVTPPPGAAAANAAPLVDLAAAETRLARLTRENERAHAGWLLLSNFLAQRRRDIQALETYDPYVDVNWRSELRENLRGLCCLIQRHPALGDAIRRRVAAGRGPLPRGFSHNHDLAAALRDDAQKPTAPPAPTPAAPAAQTPSSPASAPRY